MTKKINIDISRYIYEELLVYSFVHLLEYIKTGKKNLITKAQGIIVDLIDLANVNNEPHMWWFF